LPQTLINRTTYVQCFSHREQQEWATLMIRL
jgi:hypothetical protein